MVGVGIDGKRSALARVVVVSFDEDIVYSAFVKPLEPVTDWRTHVSGVRPEHMRHALPLRKVQADIAALLQSRTVIGHALTNDLRALMLEHPKTAVRDTAHYPPYRRQQGVGTSARRLRDVAKEFLGWEIQGSEHSPSEDAIAALRLYKLKMNDWERAIRQAGSHGEASALHQQTSKWEIALAKGKAGKKRGGIQKVRKVKRGVR